MSTPTSASKLQKILPQLFQANLPPGEPYLRFQLTPKITALISMQWVQESLLTSVEQITPLPNMPGFFIGIINSRNHVFSVIDLAQMMQLPTVSPSVREYHIIVLQTSSTASEDGLRMGLAVHKIQGISRLTEEQLASPIEDFPEVLTPYLCGCVDEAENRILVLSVEAIAEALSITK